MPAWGGKEKGQAAPDAGSGRGARASGTAGQARSREGVRLVRGGLVARSGKGLRVGLWRGALGWV